MEKEKHRMVITMKKTNHYEALHPEIVKSYSFDVSSDEELDIIMNEIYDGLLAMSFSHENIARVMHECAQKRESDAFEDEEDDVSAPIKVLYKKWYNRWLDSNSLDDFLSIEEFEEKFKNDEEFAEYWSKFYIF